MHFRMKEHEEIVSRSLSTIDHAGIHFFMMAAAMNLKLRIGISPGNGQLKAFHA